MIKRFAVVTASFSMILAAPVLGEVPPIERIAPENSILVVGAKNTQRAMDNVKKTGLWSMWQSEKIQAMVADTMKQGQEQFKQMMQELGVDEDSLTCPTGPAGLALFTVPDPDLGTPELSLLAFADYGDAAEKTDKLVRAVLDRGVKDGQLEFEEKDVAGRQMLVVDLSKMQPKEEEDDGGGFNPLPMPDPAKAIRGMTKLNYVRDGGTIMISSDMTALTDALDAIDGKGDAAAGKFAAREDFQNTLTQLGGEGDAYAILLTRDVMDLMGEGGQMMMMLRPTIRTLTGEVAGYAAGMRFDTGTAMVEQSLGIYMPNGKKGLTKLMDNPTPRGDVPAFVGADSISYMSANFDFSGLLGVMKAVVNSNPMLAAQGAEAMAQIEPMVTPIFNALGGKVVSASGPESGVMAIECKDPQGFENGFAGLAAQGGLESRDFLGQRIYTMKEGMADMLPMGVGGTGPTSIGIGGGYVFIGETPGVEQALRATGNADVANLGKDEMFRKAVGALSNDPVVAWGYSDLVATIDEMIKAREEAVKQAIADAKEWDPDMAAEMEKDMAEMSKVTGQIDPAFLKQYIGPAVWQMRSNDKGFVVNSYILPAK